MPGLKKKALLIGVDYKKTPDIALDGNVQNIADMGDLLVEAFDYDVFNIFKLRDDDVRRMPTRYNILAVLTSMVNQTANLQEIWVQFNGYGNLFPGELPAGAADVGGDFIVPSDYEKNGVITHLEIFNVLKAAKCRVVVLFNVVGRDNFMNLEWAYDSDQAGDFIATHRPEMVLTGPGPVFCLSGSMDPANAARRGNLTQEFVRVLRAHEFRISLRDLVLEVCDVFTAEGYANFPTMSASVANAELQFDKIEPVIAPPPPIVPVYIPIVAPAAPKVAAAPKTPSVAIQSGMKNVLGSRTRRISMSLGAPAPVPMAMSGPKPTPVAAATPAPTRAASFRPLTLAFT